LLESTASYQADDLHWIDLQDIDLSGWDLSGQLLTNASLSVHLRGTDLTRADLRGAVAKNSYTGYDIDHLPSSMRSAILIDTILPDGSIHGLELTDGESLRIRDHDGRNEWLTYDGPGIGPMAITVQDRLAITTGGVLQLEFEADAWDSLITFEPGIPVELGGLLELIFADDVDAKSQVGRTLRIFDWTGVSRIGQFEIRSPYIWHVANLYTTGEITLMAVPEPSAMSIALVGVLALAANSWRWSRAVPS
jgi:uncharacterized protein YjbI with pentapeptide repeats